MGATKDLDRMLQRYEMLSKLQVQTGVPRVYLALAIVFAYRPPRPPPPPSVCGAIPRPESLARLRSLLTRPSPVWRRSCSSL